MTLSACDNADTQVDITTPPLPAATTLIGGTAAIGAPIVNGVVTARCADGAGFTANVTTSADGTWQGSVAEGALPCAVRLSNGKVGSATGENAPTLYSLAEALNEDGVVVVNITPLTHLALAASVNAGADGATLDAWFAQLAPAATARSAKSGGVCVITDRFSISGVPGTQTVQTCAYPIPQSSCTTNGVGGSSIPLPPGAPAGSVNRSASFLASCPAGAIEVGSPGTGNPTPTPHANAAIINNVVAQLQTALTNLANSLNAQGYTTPAAFNPFTTTFAAVVSNAYDQLLEALHHALVTAGYSYANWQTFVQSYAAGGASLPPAQTPTEPEEPGEPGTPSGNGAALNGADGATGTLSGTTHTYTANVGWLNANNSGIFNAFAGTSQTPDALTRWDIQGVPPTVGTHTCKSNGSLPRIQLTVNGVISDTAPTGGACVIEIISVSAAGVTGRFTANLRNGITGASSGDTITDGYFRKTGSSTPVDPDPEPEPEEPTEPEENPLGTRNGLAVTLGNHTWKLQNAETPRVSSPAEHRQAAFTNTSGNQFFTPIVDETPFDGDPLTRGTLMLKKALGRQQCNDTIALTLEARIPGTFTEEGRLWKTTACELDVHYISERAGIHGTILSATLYNTTKDKSITLAGGQFRVYQNRGLAQPVTELPASAYMSMRIDQGSFELPKDEQFVMDLGNGSRVGSSFGYATNVDDGTMVHFFEGKSVSYLSWMVQNATFGSTPGTFTCGTRYTGLPTNYMNMQLWLGTYLAEYVLGSNNGGSCSITLEQASGGLYTGRYTATLIGNDPLLTNAAQRTIEISGLLRNFVLTPIRAADNGDEGELPAGQNGLSLRVDDGAARLVAGDHFRMDIGLNPRDRDPSRLRLSFEKREGNSEVLSAVLYQVPEAVGTYQCNTAYDNQRPHILVGAGFPYRAAVTRSGQAPLPVAGASCTITVTKVEDALIEGTYTATLIAEGTGAVLPDGDERITVSGSFRQGAPTE